MTPLIHVDNSPATIWETRRAYRVAGEVCAGMAVGYKCSVVVADEEPYLWLSKMIYPRDLEDPLKVSMQMGLVSEMHFLGDLFWPDGDPAPGKLISYTEKLAADLTPKEKGILTGIATLIIRVCGDGREVTHRQIKDLISRVK